MLSGSGIVWGNFIFVWNKNINLKGFFRTDLSSIIIP